MADIVDRKTRSRMMSGISGKNTKPELLVRKALFAKGYRYRLHDKKLPGKPDIVLPKYKTVVFVHGCFWHGHENCYLFRLPKSRTDFWKSKIESNIDRDRTNENSLLFAGWRIVNIWECALKGRHRPDFDSVVNQVEYFLLKSNTDQLVIRGNYPDKCDATIR